MNAKSTAELVMTALENAIAGELEAASSTLAGLGRTLRPSGMYGVCSVLAEAGKTALESAYGSSGIAGSEMWVLRNLPPAEVDPGGVFARRFIVAHANGDKATCIALFQAAWVAPDDGFVRSVTALLAEVAMLVDAVLDERDRA